MKIDVHVHTKKAKKGDADSRNIDGKRFCEIVSTTVVKIICITNHNVFDIEQYKEIVSKSEGYFQVWPGIELDILDGTNRGHLLVIVSPTNALAFNSKILSVTKNMTPDTFTIPIDSVASVFEDLNPIYIAHYSQKKPSISDEAIAKLASGIKNDHRVIKEVSNSISAGIYISHGHRSIYGSDIHDWGKYQEVSKGLPDLRLPVESFEHFCLLLEKDVSAINTILNRKSAEKISVRPFEDRLELDLTIFNDINIFFGSKGTGKSKILEAIARYYNAKGIGASVFESGADKLENLYDIKGKNFEIVLTDHGIDYCTKEIEHIKNVVEKDVTNISRYMLYFSIDGKNKLAQKIKIKDYEQIDNRASEREFKEVEDAYLKSKSFFDFVSENRAINRHASTENIAALLQSLSLVIKDLERSRDNLFVESNSIRLFNSLIKKFKLEISRKTGTPEKPASTGFFDFALNRITLESKVKWILDNIKKSISINEEYVGSLGEKGDLYCKTEVIIQNGIITDGSLASKSQVTKKQQKEFAKNLIEIYDSIYTIDLFDKIASLNDLDGVENIHSLFEMVVFKRYFTMNERPYSPSNGEISMLLLHRELSSSKDVFILDEPEKSLGNEYISETIVPLIKEKAKVGKTIFVSTHDANIAVRTLPYNSIFRVHTDLGYATYVGNPFSNSLINIKNESDKLDWKAISMRTLEGGKDAFGERGKIYGSL